jgi:hypothetical protein
MCARDLRKHRFLRLFTIAVLCGIVSGCDRPPASSAEPTPAPEWTDAAPATGLDFVHFNGMSGTWFEAEIIPPGVALFDYDNDGDLDVYCVQGQMLGNGTPVARAVFPPGNRASVQDRLFRNDLQVLADGTRVLRFTDVTATSGIRVRSYGMGVATGDFNNDGWIDLYLTRLGPNVMLKNNGDGTFTDVSRESGTDNPSWSTSATFLDIDRDGWLDLYVANYLSYSLETDKACFNAAGLPDYCGPDAYRPASDRLYHNQGDGTFRDVTASALRGGPHGQALGVVSADFNGDAWMDLYVANDRLEHDLWINQRDGTFLNAALLGGVARNADGRAEASRGVDAGDFDNDGDEDLVVTNARPDGNTVYLNSGAAAFEDIGTRSGLRPRTVSYTGFGVAWIDVDNDGWLDVLTANGAVTRNGNLGADPFPYRESTQSFRNARDGTFEDRIGRGGPLRRSDVSRGAAFGDIDNDGDVDVLIGNNSGPTRLLLNNVGSHSHWIGLRLVGSQKRDMVGARVAVVRTDGSTIWRRVRTDGSYASASDPRVVVGLGDSTDIDRIRVTWPSGLREEWTGVAPDRWTTLEEGTGR